MTRLRRIGVLGGMGPEATVALLQRVQGGVLARDDADHVPLLVDLNPQVPSRIKHLIEKTGPNPGPVIADMAERLETAGAEALILPCNTAHHYSGYIIDRVAIPFLSMPQLTCDALAGLVSSGSHVGILASPATNQTGLFQTLLSERGLKTLWPNDEDIVLATIQKIKTLTVLEWIWVMAMQHKGLWSTLALQLSHFLLMMLLMRGLREKLLLLLTQHQRLPLLIM